ncbi:alpha/beta hydrolase, partial [Agrobacterium tumefaciens]
MKVSEADILIVPGYTNSGPDHWQSRWERKLSTARRVEQAEWSKPVKEDWVARLVEEVNASTRPVVLVAHSLGVPTVIHALPEIGKKVSGALLVAPPDVANPEIRPK